MSKLFRRSTEAGAEVRPSEYALNRRTLLGIGAGTSAAFLLAACGGSDSGASGPEGVSGTVKWAWALPTSWDPVTSSAGWDVHALSLTYDALTILDESGAPTPRLAQSWSYNDAGTELTFVLRKGLVFSDGSPLDATAVKKSIERSRDQKDSLVAPQLADLKDVVVKDATTVTFVLAGPNYQYPNLVAGKTGMIVNPKAFESDAKAIATKPAGSGPFVLDSYTQNANAKLHRNDKNFDADKIRVQKLELYPLADDATVVAALTSGQYNVAQISPSQVKAAKAAGLEVQQFNALVVSVLDVNVTKAPFTDPKIVEALKFAVDREELLKVVQFGIGEVNYQPFPPGHVGYNDELKDIYAYDPAKAKSLIAESTYAGGKVPLTLSVSDPTGVPELLQSQLAKVGFDVKIETVPQAQFTQQVYIQHSKALSVDGFAGREAPFQAFQVLFSDTGLMNPGRRYVPEVKAAVEKFVQTPVDSPDYPKLLQEATRLAVLNNPNVFTYTNPWLIARGKGVSAVPERLIPQRFEGVTVSS